MVEKGRARVKAMSGEKVKERERERERERESLCRALVFSAAIAACSTTN
jgi:hypothetical protein